MATENNACFMKDIEALKLGDRSAFERIYRCFGPKLHAFTRKMVHNKEDTEEVVQEVFLKLWERKHFLDPEQNFDSYLFRIAKNLVYNKTRHQVYEMAYGKYLSRQQNAPENTTQHQIDYQELRYLLEETYTGMPATRKQVFMMSRLEGLSNGEIADQLQTSNSNIENHINKALNDIRKKLQRYKIIYLVLFFLFP
jgi:RNA polymerase sigma-70 factor, ECF subfamily